MGSYHSSFSYLGKNSAEEGFMLASFEPDSSFVDAFLGMNQKTDDSYNGTNKFFYGNQFNSTAKISITLIKIDGTDFSVADNRKVFKWLTGARKASWLDLYEGETFAYSFWGNFTNAEQYKLDGRIIGIRVLFTSLHPWAWSDPQIFNFNIGEDNLELNENGVIYKGGDETYLGIDEDGVVYNDLLDATIAFSITNDGVVYNDTTATYIINNQSDDLYSYINLNMEYKNKVTSDKGSFLSIKNITLDEESYIYNILSGETITISNGQFIVSSISKKIFGNTFNFIWPRLAPGKNEFVISGSGKFSLRFSYRYPIKIGDCALDADNLINPMCDYTPSENIGTSSKNTLGRNSLTLIDQVTKEPYAVSVANSQLYVNKV